MSKWLSILLLMVYTAASGGTVISAHYCMGDLASVSIGEREEAGCAFCGMEDEGCCHDLPQVVKMDNSNLVIPAVLNVDFRLLTEAVAFPVHFDNPNQLPGKLAFYRSAYGIHKPPVFLLNCNFRI